MSTGENLGFYGERAFPIIIDRSTAVLSCLRNLAVAREHWVGRSSDCDVAIDYGAPQRLVSVFIAKAFELVMDVEHETRPFEPPCRTTCSRM